MKKLSLGSNLEITSKDVKYVIILVLIMCVVPFLFIPGFPLVFLDKDTSIFWSKSIFVIFFESLMPIMFMVLIAFTGVMFYKVVK